MLIWIAVSNNGNKIKMEMRSDNSNFINWFSFVICQNFAPSVNRFYFFALIIMYGGLNDIFFAIAVFKKVIDTLKKGLFFLFA